MFSMKGTIKDKVQVVGKLNNTKLFMQVSKTAFKYKDIKSRYGKQRVLKWCQILSFKDLLAYEQYLEAMHDLRS